VAVYPSPLDLPEGAVDRRRYDRDVLTRLDLRGQGPDVGGRLPRPSPAGDAPLEAVRQILAEVRKRGDAAVREYTERFDRVAVDELRVDPAEVASALGAVPSTGPASTSPAAGPGTRRPC
jgi:histidinol dehydrogenase